MVQASFQAGEPSSNLAESTILINTSEDTVEE